MSDLAIGIDFGTTHSCVGVWQKGRVEIIPNDQGNRTTPSCVSFSSTERLVGDGASNQASLNPTNTVFGIKRLIGRKFDDEEVQADMLHWPFEVARRGDRPLVRVMHCGQQKELTAEEISSMILLKMKETAEAYLGAPITDAVVTVPTYYDNRQRQATHDACAIAGLRVLDTINEATAAAIAYGLDKKFYKPRNVLVFDLGGGTFDVSLLAIEDGVFEVKAVAGDTHLGGEDFDNRLLAHFVAEFRRLYRRDLSSNPRALRRLRTACERAKRTLSSATKTSIEIDSILDDIDFYTSITRIQFEDLCHDLFYSTLKSVEKVLRDSHTDRFDVQEVVLVGGSTRIPRVAKIVSDFFHGKEVNKSINPDEAMAYGAAVHAAVLSGEGLGKMKDMLLLDVAPISLGIGMVDGTFTPLINRNTIIPAKRSLVFSTHEDYQTHMLIEVYEGESVRMQDNRLLGRFQLSGIIALPRGVPQIEITFGISRGGLLNVFAMEKSAGYTNAITIAEDRGGLAREEIERMAWEAQQYKQQESSNTLRIASKNRLESYVYDLRELTATLNETISRTVEWVDSTERAEPEISAEEYDQARKDLEAAAFMIVQDICGLAWRDIPRPGRAIGDDVEDHSGTPSTAGTDDGFDRRA